MPKPRWEVALALLAWTRDGVRPSPTLTAGKHGYRTPYRGLSGLDGGSANISLELAAAHLAAGVPEALEYLEARCEDELRHGLGGGEQLSPAYEHLSFWCLVWWTSWRLGHERLCRLSGAWVERHLLVSCLLGRLEHGVLAVYAPGMRADKGADRGVGEALIAHLLGIHHPLNTNMDREERRWWWGGILLEAVRQAEGIRQVADRVRHGCLRLLSTKDEVNRVFTWAQIAFHVPVKVEIYGPQEWLAWMELGGKNWTGHPQDPAMAWGGVLGGEPTVGLPYRPGEDPAEGGWGARVMAGHDLHAVWFRGGAFEGERILTELPEPLHVTFLGFPTSDPLGDLTPVPEGQPAGGERPAPDPIPEEPKPQPPEKEEPAAPDPHAELRSKLHEIRDRDTSRSKRLPRWVSVTAHETAALLDRLGAW